MSALNFLLSFLWIMISVDYLLADETTSDAAAEAWNSQCFVCHRLDEDSIGPAHRDVFGRKAGCSPTFSNYSDALKETCKKGKIVWTRANLLTWLSGKNGPMGMIPGAAMPFSLSDPKTANLVIDYLERSKKEKAKTP